MGATLARWNGVPESSERLILWRWRNRENRRNFCGVTATDSGSTATPDATPRVAIDFFVFDEKCREKGAKDETARAELAGIDRTTLWRWRHGRQQPTLLNAARIAETFGITVDELTGRAA